MKSTIYALTVVRRTTINIDRIIRGCTHDCRCSVKRELSQLNLALIDTTTLSTVKD